MKAFKCANCNSIEKPLILREPSLFTGGVQVGGAYYKACPNCLHDIETGENRQELDVEKSTTKLAEAELKALAYDAKESAMALLYVIGIIAAIIGAIWLLIEIDRLYFWFMYWLKGTKFYYNLYHTT
ncbi:hypothetical protein [Geopseudomonas aromaticivorans]